MTFAEAVAQKGNKIMSIVNIANTHSGYFHADEVFASAVLKQLFKMLIIKRVFRPEDDADIVYDIGGGAYDHHQPDHEIRPDGIPYAAFGLIWRSFGRAYVESLGVPAGDVDFVYSMVDKMLVRSIDAIDNGVSLGDGFSISNVIELLNPEWDSDESADEAFKCAVDLAGSVLMLQVRHAAAVAKAKGIVTAAVEESRDGQVIELPCYVPWQEPLLAMTDEKAQNAKRVIFPSNRGGYNVQAVPTAPDAFTNRAPFPKELRGLRDEELAKASGIKDAVFVHPAGFIGAAMSLEGARVLAWMGLDAPADDTDD